MGSWEFAIALGDDPLNPLFVRIAQAIAEDIKRDRLRPGQRLPSTRRLANQLCVNRNTICAAYERLRAEGWITGEPARGTFVAPPRSDVSSPSECATEIEAGFDVPPSLVPPPHARRTGVIPLLGGVPELRFMPRTELARAYRRALSGSHRLRALDYGDPRGDERLRSALADLLARTRGVRASADGIVVVRGSQEAFYLLARTLLRPGDVVAVEELGYRPAWEALRLTGAHLAPVRVDEDGLVVDDLAELCEKQRVRAVYVTPHHHYPTTVTLSAPRRQRLLELARRHRLIVLEDDYDHEFHYDGRPILPLASCDDAGTVVYVGTMSKILAPGLRLGYVVAAPAVLANVTAYRMFVDRQGDHVQERAIAELLEDGVVQRHIARARAAYRARRDALCEALEREVPQLRFTPPLGGMALWARAPGVDVEGWVARGLAAGVAFQPGRLFDFRGAPIECVRLGFGACNESELADAARRLGATLRLG